MYLQYLQQVHVCSSPSRKGQFWSTWYILMKKEDEDLLDQRKEVMQQKLKEEAIPHKENKHRSPMD